MRSTSNLVDADLSTLIAAADKVLRVRSPGGEFLVHFEFQSGRDSALADRRFWYNAALCHRHCLAVQTVLVLLTSSADHRDLTGTRVFALPTGRACLSFQYDVVRLWQTSADTILQGPVGLLPTALLCDEKMNVESIIAEMDRRIQAEATPKEAESLWAASYFLMGLRYEPDTVARFLPKGRHMKESTTYQAALEEGRQTGIQIGRQEGRREEAIRMLLRLGQKAYGAAGARVQEQLESLESVEKIEALIERVNEVTSWDELLPRKARKKKS